MRVHKNVTFKINTAVLYNHDFLESSDAKDQNDDIHGTATLSTVITLLMVSSEVNSDQLLPLNGTKILA